MSKIFLCSFASEDLKRSKFRFLEQSKEMNIYENIRVFEFEDLNEDRKKQIESFFKINQKRLFGYACWKADIISYFMKQIPENSILQYSDIGCHFNKDGLNRLKEYITLCEKNNFLTFQYKIPDFDNINNFKFQTYREYQYTKNDLFKYFDINDNSEIFNSEQIWSGTIFFKKNNFSKDIINEWSKISFENNLIDDSESKSKNNKNFIEHRHDQSIFSIICKKKKILSLSASECEWAEDDKGRTWEHLKKFPILAKRDKKYNFFKRFLNRQKKNLKRIF